MIGAGATPAVTAGSTDSSEVMSADWTILGLSLASIGAVLGPALSGRGSLKDTAADTTSLAKAVG